MQSWREGLGEQLKQRNAQERDVFVQIVAAYNLLMERQKELSSRNYILEKRLQQMQPVASAGSSGSTSVDTARAMQAEEKLTKANEELTAALRHNNETMSQLIKVKLQCETQDKMLLRKEDEMTACRKRTQEIEQERELMLSRMSELQATVDMLRAETGNYRKQLVAAEDRVKSVLAENDSLVRNVLEMKNSQAEQLNNLNVEVMRKQMTPEVKAAVAQEVKSSEATVVASVSQEKFSVPIARLVLPSHARRTLLAHNGQCTSVAFDMSSGVLITAGTDSLIKLWDSRTGLLKTSFRDATQSVMSVSVSPDNSLLVGASSDKNAYLWSMQEADLLHTLTGHTNKVYAALFTDKDHILTGSHDRSLRIWDVKTGYCSRSTLCHSALNFAAVSPLGTMAATAHLDGHIRLWSLPNCELVHDIADIHSQQTTSVEFSPDGNYLLTNSKDCTIKMIDLRDLRVLREFTSPKYKNAVSWNRASFSPDGRLIVAGSQTGALCVWNADNGRLEMASSTEIGHSKPISCSSWNRSGSQLVSGDNDGVVILWDG